MTDNSNLLASPSSGGILLQGSTASPAGPGNILNGLEAWDATGTKITGVMTNRGGFDGAASFPGTGFYDGTTSNYPPSAAQIALGSTILGVAGTLDASFAAHTASQQHRDTATQQLTQKEEVALGAGMPYENADPGYRAVPRILKDDDGYVGGSVTYVNRASWDAACDGSGATGAGGLPCKCGLSGTNSERIADCAAHGTIGPEASWDGASKGNAGQGSWKLVTRTGSLTDDKGREVWQDQRTGLLWSSLLSTSLSWCKATGSNFISGNPAAEDDPSNVCDNAANQVTGTAPANKAVSACFEDDGTYFTQTDAAIDLAGKGGLSRTSSPTVAWRNPTKYDYMIAEVNGIRFVMPDMKPAVLGYEWSSSLNSANRADAWIFYSYNGSLFGYARGNAFAVRCVGR
ncbi:MAG: DUF1566 domain-containing protein [Oligoflexia bacterium]|nr:DUF1566 domain-containing protein [Oligoflexia bacterium]